MHNKKWNLLKAFQNRATNIAKMAVLVLVVVLAFPPLGAQAIGALTTYKDTLSTSRPSVMTAITGTVSVGANTVPVASTLGLSQGDTVILCTTSACTTNESKIISNIPSLTQINLTANVTGSYTASSFVELKSVAAHTITFTTHTAVTGGKFVVTIPGDATPNDGNPASGGFDFNKITTADITLAGGTAGSIATSTASTNMVITIPFSGTINSGTSITITIGGTNKLLNPTKTATSGTADTFNIETDETDGSSVVVDTSTGKVATIESVAVSATVAPSLTFNINAVTNGTTIAGNPTDDATTATTVPFGVLTVNATTTSAQYLHIDTNSPSGYAVTVQQDGSLRKSDGTTIVDFNSTAAAENDGTVGFGYSLQSKAGSPTLAFNWNDSARKFNSKGFSSTTPAQIMSNTGAANGDEAYIAYRVKVNAQQAQGIYQNMVTFIATPVY